MVIVLYRICSGSVSFQELRQQTAPNNLREEKEKKEKKKKRETHGGWRDVTAGVGDKENGRILAFGQSC